MAVSAACLLNSTAVGESKKKLTCGKLQSVQSSLLLGLVKSFRDCIHIPAKQIYAPVQIDGNGINFRLVVTLAMSFS